MRKRNFSFALDNLLWWFVYLLPIFGWLFSLILAQEVIPFTTFITDTFSFSLAADNIITSTIWSIFGTDGILPLLGNVDSGFLIYIGYFVTTYLIHLAIDVLMLLPRMVMHAMDKLGGQN